jgi:hypothetical protein
MNAKLRSILAFCLLACGCTSTGVGNPGSSATATLAITSDADTEPGATDSTQLDAGQLKHAVLVFGQLTLIACDAAEDNVVLAGPYVVDLAQNRVEPAIPSVTAPDGGFCGIDAQLAPATSPASLAGNSIFFSGTRSDGALFLLFADMAGTLRLRPRNGLEWTTDHAWLWAMRPRRWLSPAELDQSDTETLDGTGQVIVINVNRHPVLYTAIRNRLAARSTLHLDLNDNLELDSDERTGDAFIGQGLESLD